jgi:hypothetical protein
LRPPFPVVILSQLNLYAIVSVSLCYPAGCGGIEIFCAKPFSSLRLNFKDYVVKGKLTQNPGS